MNKFVFGAISGFVLALTLLAPVRAQQDSQFDRVSDAFLRISANYVHPVDAAGLLDAAIDGMASSLDPHSSYMNEKEYLAAKSATSESTGSIGFELTMRDGIPIVIAPIEGSPAAIGGVKPGDLIDAIDDERVLGRSLSEVISLLRGPIGSKVALTIRRVGMRGPLRLEFTRVHFEVDHVRFERKGTIGYVRISSLTGTTDTQVRQAIAELNGAAGPALTGFILDLRDCPGGLLDSAVALSSEFLDGGKILSTRGRHDVDTKEYDAKPGGDEIKGKPLLVLVNGGTASGAEFVAAALQDNHRARIMGTLSLGEGTVQTMIPIGKDGGMLRLTTSMVFSPSGRQIQDSGVEPDVTVIQSAGAAIADSSLGARERTILGHLPGGAPLTPSSSVVRPDPSKTYSDFQLTYALQSLGG